MSCVRWTLDCERTVVLAHVVCVVGVRERWCPVRDGGYIVCMGVSASLTRGVDCMLHCMWCWVPAVWWYRGLSLHGNSLTGSIPDGISALTGLTYVRGVVVDNGGPFGGCMICVRWTLDCERTVVFAHVVCSVGVRERWCPVRDGGYIVGMGVSASWPAGRISCCIVCGDGSPRGAGSGIWAWAETV